MSDIDSKFTSSVVLKCHHDVYHCGAVQATLCNLWNNYWIVRGRQKVKTILKNCDVCKIIQGKTPAAPESRGIFRAQSNT